MSSKIRRVSTACLPKRDVNHDGRANTAAGRVRPMSSSSSVDDRWKKAEKARPKTSSSNHGSRESVNSRPSSRPPSRQGSRGQVDMEQTRSNPVNGLGPLEAFTKSVRDPNMRPATYNDGWAVTQLNTENEGMGRNPSTKRRLKSRSSNNPFKSTKTHKKCEEIQ